MSVQRRQTVVEGRGKRLRWVAVTAAALMYSNGSVSVTYEFHFDSGEWRLYGFRRD